VEGIWKDAKSQEYIENIVRMHRYWSFT